MKLIKGTYKKDCIFLLKDLTGKLNEITIEEKEKYIAKGISYSNYISKEEVPNENVAEIFKNLLSQNKYVLGGYIQNIANSIIADKKDGLILVSLARAGTPYGILIKRFLKFKHNINVKHYSISIIRGCGIDFNALKYILDNNKNANIQFVDGWTGKGSIISELQKSIEEFNKKFNCKIDCSLATIADPAKLSKYYGTREDILLPNALLNATVSGLISRTILNKEYISENEFHGAININYLIECDLSNFYVDEISNIFADLKESESPEIEDVDINYAKYITDYIAKEYKVLDKNKIKLSIGETSRVLLRRKAKQIFINDIYKDELKGILELAKIKGVKIENLSGIDYKAIAIID